MAQQPRTPPGRSEAGQAARAERETRLAEALRDNLRKRKAQVRDRVRDRAAAGGSAATAAKSPGAKP
jgi:hypothetical protein